MVPHVLEFFSREEFVSKPLIALELVKAVVRPDDAVGGQRVLQLTISWMCHIGRDGKADKDREEPLGSYKWKERGCWSDVGGQKEEEEQGIGYRIS